MNLDTVLDIQELNVCELVNIEGGSELSDAIMYGLGVFCSVWYYAATGSAIRPSQYR